MTNKLFEAVDNVIESSDITESTLSFDEMVIDAYYHYANDLGKIPTLDDVTDDILYNYEQDYISDETPETYDQALKDVKYVLNRNELEYDEGGSEDVVAFDKEKELLRLHEDSKELKSLLRDMIDQDLEDFKKSNPGKSDYFVKNNYNADSVVDAFNDAYDTHFSWIMSEDRWRLPYVQIVDNTADNITSIYNTLMSDGEAYSPANNRIIARDGVARRSNAYDWGNDDCKSFNMSDGEEAFANWVKEIDKVPVRVDHS